MDDDYTIEKKLFKDFARAAPTLSDADFAAVFAQLNTYFGRELSYSDELALITRVIKLNLKFNKIKINYNTNFNLSSDENILLNTNFLEFAINCSREDINIDLGTSIYKKTTYSGASLFKNPKFTFQYAVYFFSYISSLVETRFIFKIVNKLPEHNLLRRLTYFCIQFDPSGWAASDKFTQLTPPRLKEFINVISADYSDIIALDTNNLEKYLSK